MLTRDEYATMWDILNTCRWPVTNTHTHRYIQFANIFLVRLTVTVTRTAQVYTYSFGSQLLSNVTVYNMRSSEQNFNSAD